MQDRAIIDALLARDESVIGEIEAKCGRLCRSIARNILRSDEDAEECVNDAYLRIWQSIPPAEPESIVSYAGMITRRLAISRYREKHAAARAAEVTPIEELDAILKGDDEVSARLEVAELAAAVNAFLGTLERESRIIFVRRYWYMDSTADIAARLGMTDGGVRARLHRVRRKLRKELERSKLL